MAGKDWTPSLVVDLGRTFAVSCPFCPRVLWFTTGEPRPVHAEPMCARFASMSDVEFIGYLDRAIDVCTCSAGDA